MWLTQVVKIVPHQCALCECGAEKLKCAVCWCPTATIHACIWSFCLVTCAFELNCQSLETCVDVCVKCSPSVLGFEFAVIIFIHSFTHPPMSKYHHVTTRHQSFIHSSFIHSSLHLFIHPSIHSPTHSINSPIHPPVHSFTHPSNKFTHSLTCHSSIQSHHPSYYPSILPRLLSPCPTHSSIHPFPSQGAGGPGAEPVPAA